MGGEQSTAQQSNTAAKVPGGKDSGYRLLLNVYEPAESQGITMPGFGVYHSGLEIAGTEYTFAGGQGQLGTGIMSHRPKAAPPGSPWKYKQTEDLGPLMMDRSKMLSILEQLKPQFKAAEYDLLAKNCNHFTEAFATSLGAKYPAWVNRAAKLGNNFRGMAGQGQAPGAPAKAIEPKKSVFETSQGYSLTASSSGKSKSNTSTGSGKSTGKTTGKGKEERYNPWRDPNFMPGKKSGAKSQNAK
jgi:hypothetical protein